MPSKNCEFCGELFFFPQWRELKYNVRFCSRSCQGQVQLAEVRDLKPGDKTNKLAYNNAQIEISCLECTQPFKVSPSRKEKKKFCSQNCYTAYQTVNNSVNSYKRITINGKRVLLHRYLMEQVLGRKLEVWEHVDHINRHKGDNRISNLRILTIWEHGALSASQRGVPV